MDIRRRKALFFVPVLLLCLCLLKYAENMKTTIENSSSDHAPSDSSHLNIISNLNENEPLVDEILEDDFDIKLNTSKQISKKKRIHKISKRDTNATDVNFTSPYYDDLNTTENCTNDYCIEQEDYIDRIEAYIYPKSYEWVLIALHSIVFLVGLIGNALVCVAVYRNHSMRTVTNYFIVNLAVADFMVILFCLPPTVLWDVTETWFFGKAMCKIVLYIQVSVFQ